MYGVLFGLIRASVSSPTTQPLFLSLISKHRRSPISWPCCVKCTYYQAYVGLLHIICTNNHVVNLLFTTFCKFFSRKRRNICLQNVFYTICVCQDKSYLLLHIVKAKIGKPLFHQSIVWHINCFATKHFCIHHSLLDGSTTPQ